VSLLLMSLQRHHLLLLMLMLLQRRHLLLMERLLLSATAVLQMLLAGIQALGMRPQPAGASSATHPTAGCCRP
jgi:hypothetical protein